MARRTINEPEKIHKQIQEVLQGTPEASQLTAILESIAKQQEELSGYIARIESVTKDLEALETKKDNLALEINEIEKEHEAYRVRLDAQLEPARKEIETLENYRNSLIQEVETQKEITEKAIKEDLIKIAASEATLGTVLVEHDERRLALQHEEEGYLERSKTAKNELEEWHTTIEVAKNHLAEVTAQTEAAYQELKDLKAKKSDIENNIATIKEEHERTETEYLQSQQKNIAQEEVAKARLIQLQEGYEKRTKELEEENKKKELEVENVRQSLAEITEKFESVKQEYQKVTGMIASFIMKKSEVERKEEIIKKKYEEAGFSW